VADLKGERRGLGTAASGNREDLRTEADAEHGLAHVQHRAGQVDFLPHGGQVAAAGAAPGTAAEQDQAVAGVAGAGHRALLGERAEVAEADTAAFEVVLDQAEVLGRGVLHDIEAVHADSDAERGASPGASPSAL
jgi:hypothetical protein